VLKIASEHQRVCGKDACGDAKNSQPCSVCICYFKISDLKALHWRLKLNVTKIKAHLICMHLRL